jgi:cytochrome c oxidase cbb3-type subunit 3
MRKRYPRWQVVSVFVLSALIAEPARNGVVSAAGLPGPPVGANALATAPISEAALKVYRTTCLLCHDVDGRGELGRENAPSIPDFTDTRWQASRSDGELSHSILEGKGKAMPRMKAKLGSVDVKLMVAVVRGFRDGKLVIEEEPEPAPSTANTAATRAVGAQPNRERSQASAAKPQPTQEGRAVFQKTCAMCHGRDGKGEVARDSLPSIPDFTVRDWHQKRTNAQLLISILDGKGTEMPAFRDKVPRERAREVVNYIRTFAPGAAPASGSSTNDFEDRFNKLAREFDELARQIRALSASAPSGGNEPSGTKATEKKK